MRKSIRNLLILFIPLLLLSLYGGCGNNGGGGEFICSLEQMQDRFANTQCIAEELVVGCSNIVCRTIDGQDIRVGNFENDCEVIDCETLDCDPILVQNGELMLVPGFLTDLTINEISGLPSGVFDIEETQSPFECIFIAVD